MLENYAKGLSKQNACKKGEADRYYRIKERGVILSIQVSVPLYKEKKRPSKGHCC